MSLSREPEKNSITIEGHLARKARLDFEIASSGFSLSAFPIFSEMLARADVVHYHYPWPMMDAVHFLARVRKPTVVTYHSDIVRQRLLKTVYSPLMRRFLDSVGAVVATSPNYVASSPILRDYSRKLTVIPLGARDIARTPLPHGSVASWRKRLGERFFLFVGALRYYKGLTYLLDAAERTGLPVAIIGTGEQETELAAELARRKLTNVHLLGELSEIDKAVVLSLAYGFVFPSHLRSEAFGVALLEAAASSLPLICCELGTGTSFVNQHGVTGLVVPPADGEALAVAMHELWNDPERAAAMGLAARQRYERLFTADAMGAAYARLYGDLVAGARRGYRVRTDRAGTLAGAGALGPVSPSRSES